MTKLVNKDAERLNPCLKEQEMSYACLNRNGYVQAECAAYFDNYNTCKKFWGQVSRERRAKGIYPILPDIEDRPKIKAEFAKYAKGQS